jgi:SAM-dependent methyltransferase
MLGTLEGPGSIGAALDLRCAAGAVTKALFSFCRERVVEIDFSRGMLEQARRNVGESPLGATAARAARFPGRGPFRAMSFEHVVIVTATRSAT